MALGSGSRYVSDETALCELLSQSKLRACPHCGRIGALIGHGFLRGYAERGSEVEVRGRRFFCSNRQRRPGCGRTFSVALMTVLTGFMVRTLTLFRFAQTVLGGQTRRAAWLCEASGAFSLSSGYRLWRRLQGAQSGLRSRLSREACAPPCAAREPLAQLLAHFALVLGDDECDLFAVYQDHLQSTLLESHRT